MLRNWLVLPACYFFNDSLTELQEGRVWLEVKVKQAPDSPFHNSKGSGYYSLYQVQHDSGHYELNAFNKSLQYQKTLWGASKLMVQNASFLYLSCYCEFSLLNIKWDHVFIKCAIGQKPVRHTCTTASVLWVRVKKTARMILCLAKFLHCILCVCVSGRGEV